ncbi:protein ALWAYS EARLY 3 isoform X1 [Ziziphus jujuba]|uniref:protein ALWAYS Early 3 isoform X1 n=4 Tax=Ziziphus jujuba TaxID=326968 RepID=A0A6P4ACF8_ZIZJJ|nr:protein ALWAYS EARLY 3 isoform X1 [Ziziphus jujuba]XP_015892698.3 protein ALWAYS EARLY 3 isoform X1 [Ziziphus jujuba]XP_015892700.3 protein ALWAYS EARLY 3 isoform X1 [Ziziphus jujuba]
MAPSRKSRSVNKRFSYVNEVSSYKTGENANKSRQKKRKLSDMLGPQWSEQELERFYEAYRKHGKDWKKVATVVRNRSVEMIEALYTMNRAYLSLPEGTASVVGLIAMMTDHYCVLGGSDSEQESNDGTGASHKPQKRARGQFQSNTSKGLDEHFPDVSQSQSVASSNGCLSLLKKRRSGIMPHAVRKRTPRVPVSYSDKDNRERKTPPSKQNLKHNIDPTGDDVAHEIAMALTEASQKGGSPQGSWISNRKVEGAMPTLYRNGERMSAKPEKTITKLCYGGVDKGGCELSLGSTEADKRDYDRNESYLMDKEGAEAVEFQQKGKRYHVNKPDVKDSVNDLLDGIKEAGSGTEEQKLSTAKGRSIGKGLRKRSKKALFVRDEDSPFDALKTLADMSLMMPETPTDPEPAVRDKGENFDVAIRSTLKGSHLVLGVEDTAFTSSKLEKAKEGTHHFNAGIQKRKRKSFPFKMYKNEGQTDSHLSDNQKLEVCNCQPKTAMDWIKKSTSKGKRSSHSSPNLKQGKLVKPLETTSSSTYGKSEETDSILSSIQVPSANQPPTKMRNRWKKQMQKPPSKIDTKTSENVLDDQSKLPASSLHNKELNLEERLSNCLSWYQAQRWSIFEWFYSAIDYPWFAKREFVEYLNHVGLGHVPRLTRVEWGVIRSSLGKPRRFSEHFLKEEKDKLNQYRESVRRHYSELRAGTREGLPTDLARPLSVGQRVIAIHPRTRKIQDGSILTVDHSRCYVQFDRPDLGVEYVMDIDCMPLNPLENLPASFTRQNSAVDRLLENLKEIRINEQLKEGKSDDCVKIASTENQDNICKLSKHSEGYSSSSELEAKVVHGEATKTQKVANSQPSILAQIQAKEDDVQALSELTRALDKKEVVVSELKCLHDELMENQKDGDNSLKDSEPFKKQYAAILLRLNEVNEQVSSALLCLRQRNTYQGSSQNMLLKAMGSLNDPGSHSSSCVCSTCRIHEPGSNVAEIVESSRIRAQKMVDIAMQALSSLKMMENGPRRIEEAIDFINKRLSEEDFGMLTCRPCTDSFVASPDQLTAGTSKPSSTRDPPDPASTTSSNKNETKFLSELIAHCIATLLMIQKCTERQFPPADVARVLDSAVTSLQPFCSQNVPVYAEIQKCMGILRNQILALVPT